MATLDNIWKIATKKACTQQKQLETAVHSANATALTAIPTEATGNLSTTPPAPNPSYKTKTMTLEELTETCHQLV
jgi:hypothetical protein